MSCSCGNDGLYNFLAIPPLWSKVCVDTLRQRHQVSTAIVIQLCYNLKFNLFCLLNIANWGRPPTNVCAGSRETEKQATHPVNDKQTHKRLHTHIYNVHNQQLVWNQESTHLCRTRLESVGKTRRRKLW